MSAETRRARVKAFAKINLSLEVLLKRPDGFHDIRTIFQTISLADTIRIEWTPARRTSIRLEADVDIENNLIVRAAEALVPILRTKAEIRFQLTKRIPMGGGLGGGSTDAAAVLLALPALAGRPVPLERLMEVASALGSDVPFFLIGGTALGFGRGVELYPLSDVKAGPSLVVAPEVHVSTPEAYRSLNRPSLTPDAALPKINICQSVALAMGGDLSSGGWPRVSANDFESVVFHQHPKLSAIRRKLERSGGMPARMTGSGSALFAVFSSGDQRRQAMLAVGGNRTFPVSFLGRMQYRAHWRRQLRDHIQGSTWPPQSRY